MVALLVGIEVVAAIGLPVAPAKLIGEEVAAVQVNIADKSFFLQAGQKCFLLCFSRAN